MSKQKPNWLEALGLFLFILVFSPTFILDILIGVTLVAWERLHGRRDASAVGTFVAIEVMSLLIIVWAIVLLIALVTVCYRSFLAH